MAKYVVAVLAFIVALIGLILFIGEDANLVITSTSVRPFLNFETQISWRITIVALTLGLIVLFALWAFLGFLIRLPGRVKSGVGLRRRTQALEAMEEALIAGTQGDSAKARKKAEKARNLISSPALGRMISAQAAEASGDNIEAIAQYTAMLDDQKTLVTGQRGLAQHMLTSGDISGAISHAQTAYEDNKDASWAFDILLQALVSDYQWARALEILDKGISRKHMDKVAGRRRRAVLQSALADHYNDMSDFASAQKYALAAVSDAPDFAPAISLAAQLLRREGQSKKAASLIEKAWGSSPHPALSMAYRDLYRNETSKVRNKKIKTLVKANPTHRESLILMAEEALRQEDGVAAWSALSSLVTQKPVSARLCMLASASETMLKNNTDARIWLERAASAPSEPDWTDIDPEGDGFDYTDSDWRRLVFSYGETGTLIHPRFEAGAKRRSVLPMAVHMSSVTEAKGETDNKRANDVKDVTDAASDAPRDSLAEDPTTTPTGFRRQPDDPGPGGQSDTDDLAKRLDNLLGDDKA